MLEKINNWIHNQDKRCLFWLSGLAGTGKSTIARTIARLSYEEGHLGASFFFSRGGGDVGTAEKFVTSIAQQLASHSPILREYICESLYQCRDIANWSLHDQWHQLILQPFSKLKYKSRRLFVFIVDALDECDDNNNIITVLQLLAEAQSTESVQLRIFLTSRPEVPVRYVFYKIPAGKRQDIMLHEIQLNTINHDIYIFFEKKLEEIAEHYYLDAGWPGKDLIEQLVHNASGLFIWAATACRFINEGEDFAGDRLSTIIQSAGSGTTPQKHLDQIYLTVLNHSISPNYSDLEKGRSYKILRDILGTIVILYLQLSTDSVGKLLCLTNQAIQRALKNLHAILAIPEDSNHLLRLHHPSFRDFLLDDQRCTNADLYVNEKEAHWQLYIKCIRLMSDVLKQDICGLGAPGTLLVDVAGSHVKQCLPPELQYACLYWV